MSQRMNAMSDRREYFTIASTTSLPILPVSPMRALMLLSAMCVPDKPQIVCGCNVYMIVNVDAPWIHMISLKAYFDNAPEYLPPVMLSIIFERIPLITKNM